MSKHRLGKGKTIYAILVMAAMFIAITIKSVIPAGFMPVMNAGGYTEMVICSGAGEAVVKIPNNDGADGDGHSSESGPCPFMTLAHAVVIPAPVFDHFLFDISLENASEPTHEAAWYHVHALPFPPRAPPAVNLG